MLVNSKKGKEVFDKINNSMETLNTDLEYAISYNPCIVKSVKYNYNRDEFLNC